MAKAALKKPAADLQPVAPGPTFTVVPKDGPAPTVNPFGNDDPLAAIGESAAKKTGGKSYPRNHFLCRSCRATCDKR